MSQVPSRRDGSPMRWAAASSFAFFVIGWMIGITVPGEPHGASITATLLFAFGLAVIAWLPGKVVGDALAELHRPR